MMCQCKQCLAMKDVPPGVDPHSLTWCGCCTVDHHHGESVMSAAACEAANHPGQPYHLRLMTTQGSNTANGTEATSGNCPGYTALGNSLGTTFCAAPSGGQQTNANSVTWSATGTWSAIPSIEAWDTAGTPLRYLQGALTSSITGVVNGDSVQFAAGSVTLNWSTA